jgi:hypothetical protein
MDMDERIGLCLEFIVESIIFMNGKISPANDIIYTQDRHQLGLDEACQ